MRACVSVYGCVHLSPVLSEARGGCWVPEARVPGGWEPPSVSTRNWSCVFCKSSKHLSTKLSSQPSFLFHSLWDTLTNVVNNMCEGHTSYFFLRKIHLLTQPQKQECNPLQTDRQTDRLPKHVARSQGSHILQLPLGKPHVLTHTLGKLPLNAYEFVKETENNLWNENA